VALPDQNSGMMDALRKAVLKYLCLQATLQEVFNFKSEHIIEAHARLVEYANPHETTDKCIALEKTLWVFIVELEKLTGSTTDFG